MIIQTTSVKGCTDRPGVFKMSPQSEGSEDVEYLKALGSDLQRYLKYLGGKEAPPSWLKVEERGMRGVETCTCCGGWVNMGSFTIENTLNNTSLSLPYVAVHALVEHGKSEFSGTLHKGKVDVEKLQKVIAPPRKLVQ